MAPQLQPRIVEFEGSKHEFPGDATDDEIRKALSGSNGSPPSKTKSKPSQGIGQKILDFRKQHPYIVAGASLLPGLSGLDPDVGKGVAKTVASDLYGLTEYAGPVGMAAHGLAEVTGLGKKIRAGTERKTPGEKVGGYATTAAEMLMPIPGVGEAEAPKTIEKAARSVYETELRPSTKISLAQRKEMVTRGLKSGLPIEEKSLKPLETAIESNKAKIEQLTKDPASPYSGRSVPVADLLIPIDKFIARVARVDAPQAKTLTRARATWVKSLGGGADTTIADAQKLKEDLYAVINSSAYGETAEPGTMTAGRKLAARGMKTGIERAIPEEPIQAINHAIENDIRLKDSINAAIKKHPSWINDWAVFVLGSGAAEAVRGLATGSAVEGGVGAATAIGALTRMAARNPRIMSRLAIALDKSGVAIPKLVRAGAIAAEREKPEPERLR